MKTAKLIEKKENCGHFNSNQRLYQLSEPHEGHEFVQVSAVNAPFTGPETYIFGSDSEGNVKEFLELEGSFRGEINHEKALANAGYSVEDGEA